jgi:hypothetical protein
MNYDSVLRAEYSEYVLSRGKLPTDADPDKQGLYDVIDVMYRSYNMSVSSWTDPKTLKNIASSTYKIVRKQLSPGVSIDTSKYVTLTMNCTPFPHGGVVDHTVYLSDVRIGNIVEFQSIITMFMGARGDKKLSDELIRYLKIISQIILQDIKSVFYHKDINLLILDYLYQY